MYFQEINHLLDDGTYNNIYNIYIAYKCLHSYLQTTIKATT